MSQVKRCQPPPSIVHLDVYVLGELRHRRAIIGQERVTIGRAPDADICFTEEDRIVSTHHAELVRSEGGYLLRDTGSRNGVFLHEGSTPQPLPQPGVLATGALPLRFSLGAGGPLCQVAVGELVPFDDYLVTAELGEGGMATVFIAQEQSGLSRLVVLKLIAPSLLHCIDQKAAVAMLEEEARIASQICHPNVVNIFKAGCFDGVHYISMEHLRGINFGSIQKQLAHAGGACPYDLAAALLSQACRGLHAAHEARDSSGRALNVVHRDFTPSNLVCSPEGDVKLIDFGVARALGHRSLSTAGGFVGKAAYASPEQILHPQGIDRRSDVFAAGVILYELCAGRPLFLRDSDFATMGAVVQAEVPPLEEAPAALNALLARALAREPERRPATAAILAEELEHLVLETGGQYFKRKQIAQTLRQLGVDLHAPQPRALVGRPPLFSASALRAQARRPEAPHPSALRPPEKVELHGRVFRVGQLLESRALGGDTDCIYAVFEALQPHDAGARASVAGADESTLSDEAGAADAPCGLLHLVGGAELTVTPPADVTARLADFLSRWDAAPALGPLLRALPAWPAGPHALLEPALDPADGWAAHLVAAPDAARSALSRRLAQLLAERAAALDLPHGELRPAQVELSADGGGRILLGGTLDAVLAAPGTPLRPSAVAAAAPYLAPERHNGDPPSEAGDVYAAAAMIYELLGGDLTRAAPALRSGGRLIPLPSAAVPAAVRDLLTTALRPDPRLRPGARELARQLASGSSPEISGLRERLRLPVPAPQPYLATELPDGARVHVYSEQIRAHGARRPTPLPLNAVPHLLPAAIGLVMFRETLTIELTEEPGPGGARPRLYEAEAASGTARLFLSSPQGAFEVGSRTQNRLQRIEYVLRDGPPGPAGDGVIALPALSLELCPARPGRLLTLWTRDPRTGDVHLCCASIS